MKTILLKSGTDWHLLVRAQPVENLALYQIRAGLIGPSGDQVGPDLVDGMGLERVDIGLLLTFAEAETRVRPAEYQVVLEFTPLAGQEGIVQEIKIPIRVEHPSLR
jgi:hypothetical protein